MLSTILFGFYVYLGGAVIFGMANELSKLANEARKERRHQACFERSQRWSLAESLS